MKNLSFKQQLAFAFAASIIVVFAVSLFALLELRDANDRFSGYVNGSAERQSLATDVRMMANRRAIGVRDMVLVQNNADLESAKAMAVTANDELKGNLTALKAAVAAAANVTEKERALFGRIEEIESRYSPVAVAIVELAASGKQDEAIKKMNVECRPLLGALLASAKEYVLYSKKMAAADVDASALAYANQRTWLVGLSALAVLGAVLLGWFITRRLMDALGAEPACLSNVAECIARGDLRTIRGVEAAPAGSVLASMAVMRGQLVALIGQVRTSAHSIATASAEIVSVQAYRLDAASGHRRASQSAGVQRCGNSSSMRLFGCVGSRSSTSLR